MAICFEPPCGSNGDGELVASIRDEVALERAFQCMRLIHQKGGLFLRELPDKLKISNGAAYYVLNALIAKGYVIADNFKNSSKKQAIFIC